MNTWTATDVFGSADAGHGWCCDCCDGGYCPRDEAAPSVKPPLLFRVGAYLTDKYVAINADLIDHAGADIIPSSAKVDWLIPAMEPPTSTIRFRPSQAARLTALGIDIRGDDKPAHLYHHGEHIGYIMGTHETRGSTLAEVSALARLAEKVRDSGPESSAAMLLGQIHAEPMYAIAYVLDMADAFREFLAGGDPS